MSRARWPLTGLTLAALWLFIRGMALDPVRIAEELVIGLGVGMALSYSVRRLYQPRIDFSGGLRSLPYAVVYVGLFTWELLTANLEVAYRVLHPRMPIDPAVIEIPLRVRSDLAITTIANSITLTPGTLTMDYDPERNALYVHTLAGVPEEVVAPIRRWEDYALVIFDEPLSPGDPVQGSVRTAGDAYLEDRSGAGPENGAGDPDPGDGNGGEADGD